MTLNEGANFLSQYLDPLTWLPLFGVIVGAWLASWIPYRLKRLEWRWEKQIFAKEQFFETVSRVQFIAEHYLKCEYEERFSMSGLTMVEANEEIMRLIKELHSGGHKIKLYLSKSDAALFGEYISASQAEYDVARANWGEWGVGDDAAVAQHFETTIARQGQVAAVIVNRFKMGS